MEFRKVERKNRIINFRVCESEYKRICEAAGDRNMQLSEFILACIHDGLSYEGGEEDTGLYKL